MRLIDADELVFDYSGLIHMNPYDFEGILKYFAKQIARMPTIEPYTLCKDCIYHEDDEAENYEYCTEWQRETHGDWSCSRGGNSE